MPTTQKQGVPSKKFGPKLLLGTAAAVALIVAFEGGKDKDGSSVAYADKLAGGLPTVCAGLTRHVTKTPIVVGERWSAEKCQREESAAIAKVQVQLEKCFGPVPPQSVFDAATSFAWNVGVPAACKSGAMQYWQRGDWRTGCNRMARSLSGKRVWVLSGGKFRQGLANRRDYEARYCLGGV